MAKQQPSDRSRAVTTQVGVTRVSKPARSETDPAVKEGDLFDIQVTLNGDSQLRPQDFSSDAPSPGFSVRFRQMLLNAGDGYLQLLQADNSLRGTLTVTIRVDKSPPEAWYQETDAWMLNAARAAIRNPERHRRAKGTPKGLVIDAVFQPGTTAKTLAPSSNTGQGTKLNPVQPQPSRMPSTDEQFQSLLQMISRESPAGFAAKAERFIEVGHAFRKTVASLLQGPLNDHLQTLPQETPHEKQAIAVWVNAQMRALGLAIRCPKTGRPSVLISDIKESGSEIGRFRFENRDEQGAKVRSWTSTTLPELELMEDLPRREPLLDWSQRTRKKETRKRE